MFEYVKSFPDGLLQKYVSLLRKATMLSMVKVSNIRISEKFWEILLIE